MALIDVTALLKKNNKRLGHGSGVEHMASMQDALSSTLSFAKKRRKRSNRGKKMEGEGEYKPFKYLLSIFATIPKVLLFY